MFAKDSRPRLLEHPPANRAQVSPGVEQITGISIASIEHEDNLAPALKYSTGHGLCRAETFYRCVKCTRLPVVFACAARATEYRCPCHPKTHHPA